MAGAATAFDVSDRSWDWQAILPENLNEVRAELDIAEGGMVASGGAWDALGRGDS